VEEKKARPRGRPRKSRPEPKITVPMETQTSRSLLSPHTKATKAVRQVLHNMYGSRGGGRGRGRGRSSRGLQLRREPGRVVFESPELPSTSSTVNDR
jgi:hypothetical protein